MCFGLVCGVVIARPKYAHNVPIAFSMCVVLLFSTSLILYITPKDLRCLVGRHLVDDCAMMGLSMRGFVGAPVTG